MATCRCATTISNELQFATKALPNQCGKIQIGDDQGACEEERDAVAEFFRSMALLWRTVIAKKEKRVRTNNIRLRR